jgi:hypothetical protein
MSLFTRVIYQARFFRPNKLAGFGELLILVEHPPRYWRDSFFVHARRVQDGDGILPDVVVRASSQLETPGVVAVGAPLSIAAWARDFFLWQLATAGSA